MKRPLMSIGLAFWLFSLDTLPLSADGDRAPGAVWYPIPKGAVFSTGDAWAYQTVTYRLYGVQACLRGTRFHNARGLERDCGEASLAVLAALIRDLAPTCRTIVEDVAQRTRFVVCMATVREGPAAGARLDLGTALVTQGFGFASRRVDGSVVHPPYAVAEEFARSRKAGLWAFADFPHPNALIARGLDTNPALVDGLLPRPGKP